MRVDPQKGFGVSGVEFEWDEGKRLATLEKHGIDFLDAVEGFEGRPLILRSSHEDEERFIAVGPMDGIVIAVSSPCGAGPSAS